jgi:phosphocarrier protein HPr
MNIEKEFLQQTVIVGNEYGLHARVATSIAKALRNHSCDVLVMKDGVQADGRSVLDLLLLAATPGSEIIVQASGPDAEAAVKEISRLVQNEQ